MTEESNPRCPKCHSEDTVRILYGLPTEEAMAAAERGEIALGGCLVDPGNPDWRCRSCSHSWADLRS